ncbi:kinase-like domain-containing protein [Xylaria curta]|nr:kinase-like domain-containing protein [Xylaria curta]
MDSTSSSTRAEALADAHADARIDPHSDCGTDDDVDADSKSDSSSLVYDHEPFATFQLRTRELGQKLWPNAAPGDIIVERLRGGGYNRIIGLTHLADEYVLRVPRFEFSDIRNDVAALHFVHHFTTITAPKVIQFDETDQNELGRPFLIQNRIPGTNLLSTYPILSHPQRCRVAHELGTVFAHMLAVKSSTAGVFMLPLHGNSEEAQVNIAPLCDKSAESYSFSSSTNTTAANTVLQLLTDCVQAKKDGFLIQGPPARYRVDVEYMDRFITMASELDEDGWLANHHYSLAHLDFAPRNILVNPTSDMQLPIVSGILDWDNAILAPMFMSCQPPLWIWGWKDDEDEDERTANEEPPTAEARQLKKLFEDAAGPDYLRLAYQPAYRLARQLVSLIINGLRSNEDLYGADAMLKEWEAIRNEPRTEPITCSKLMDE